MDKTLVPSPLHRFLLKAIFSESPVFAQMVRENPFEAELANPDPHTGRLLPLYHARLLKEGLAANPSALEALLKSHFLRNSFLLSQAKEAARALRARRIRSVFLKGIPMAVTNYGDLSLRPMADIDLLVFPQDVDRAADCLRRAGWVDKRSSANDGLSLERDRRFIHAWYFSKQAGDLDLHWYLTRVTLNEDLTTEIFSHSVRMDLAGEPAERPCTTDQLFHTLLHSALYTRCQWDIIWIADALTILRHDSRRVDWARISDLAARFQVTTRVREPLEFLRSEFGAAISERDLRRLSHARVALSDRLDRKGRNPAPVYRHVVVLFNVASIFLRSGRTLLSFEGWDFLLGYFRYCFSLRSRRELPLFFLRTILRPRFWRAGKNQSA